MIIKVYYQWAIVNFYKGSPAFHNAYSIMGLAYHKDFLMNVKMQFSSFLFVVFYCASIDVHVKYTDTEQYNQTKILWSVYLSSIESIWPACSFYVCLKRKWVPLWSSLRFQCNSTKATVRSLVRLQPSNPVSNNIQIKDFDLQEPSWLCSWGSTEQRRRIKGDFN